MKVNRNQNQIREAYFKTNKLNAQLKTSLDEDGTLQGEIDRLRGNN